MTGLGQSAADDRRRGRRHQARGDDHEGVASLRRGGNALALNTAVSGLFGFAFWVVAARVAPAADVGRDGALINLGMILASTLASALGVALGVIMPQAAHPRRLLTQAYGACVAFGVLAGVVFSLLPLGGHWAEMRSPGTNAVLVVMVALWGVFALQDTVLVVCRKAHLVPIENAAFGVAKLVVLPLLAWTGLDHAILVATVVPLVPLVAWVNVVLHRSLGRLRPAGPGETAIWWPNRRLIGGELLSAVVGHAQLGILPMVVVGVAGAREGGYYYVASLLGTQISLFAVGTTATFMIEASRQRHRQRVLAREAWWRATVLTAVLSGGLFVFAPLVMATYGPDYVAGGTWALRLMCLASLVSPVLLLYMAIGRVRRRANRAVATSLVMGAIGIVATATLARAFGATGAGLASLAIVSPVVVVGPLLVRDLGYRLEAVVRWPGLSRRVLPLVVRSGAPLGSGPALVLASGLALPVLLGIRAPLAVSIPVVLLAGLLLPGMVAARSRALVVSRWLDARWAPLLAVSLAAWVLFSQLLLECGLWSPVAVAVGGAVLSAARVATWAVQLRARPQALPPVPRVAGRNAAGLPRRPAPAIGRHLAPAGGRPAAPAGHGGPRVHVDGAPAEPVPEGRPGLPTRQPQPTGV